MSTTISITISPSGNHVVVDPGSQPALAGSHHFAAAPDVNSDPDRLKFAYWVPNVSGGLVISKIPQKTKCDARALPFVRC
jgi:hypothetical protein